MVRLSELVGCKFRVGDWSVQMAVYQMYDLRRQVLGKGNYGKATPQGEKASEDVYSLLA